TSARCRTAHRSGAHTRGTPHVPRRRRTPSSPPVWSRPSRGRTPPDPSVHTGRAPAMTARSRRCRTRRNRAGTALHAHRRRCGPCPSPHSSRSCGVRRSPVAPLKYTRVVKPRQAADTEGHTHHRLPSGATIRLCSIPGVPEVRGGDDLASLLATALEPFGVRDGDVLCISTKVVSKALGLVVAPDQREAAITASTARTVARRRHTRVVTSVVQIPSGP